jgi:hypothetical protein
MKDLIDIIAETLTNRADRENILLLVENLYFTDVQKSWWRRSSASKESTKIAHDIINLQNSLNVFRKIEGVPIKSELMRQAVNTVNADGECKGILSWREVNSDQKEYFEMQVLTPNRNYVTAVMLAELIRDEKRRLKYNQVLTYLIPICTALISATAAVILTKFWG